MRPGGSYVAAAIWVEAVLLLLVLVLVVTVSVAVVAAEVVVVVAAAVVVVVEIQWGSWGSQPAVRLCFRDAYHTTHAYLQSVRL